MHPHIVHAATTQHIDDLLRNAQDQRALPARPSTDRRSRLLRGIVGVALIRIGHALAARAELPAPQATANRSPDPVC
jgi:hypothetical protein